MTDVPCTAWPTGCVTVAQTGFVLLPRDGNPVVHLGHRRLVVIDAQGGVQPMATADGRWWIVFNGEIYSWAPSDEWRNRVMVDAHSLRRPCGPSRLCHRPKHGRRLPENAPGFHGGPFVPLARVAPGLGKSSPSPRRAHGRQSRA
jgi:hypothetical protein